MSEAQVIIDTDVRCSDGPCGRLRRLIVDHDGRRLTHLAVKAEEFQTGHLVPADQIASAGRDVVLRCSIEELEGFGAAEEMLLPPEAPEQESWPYVAHNFGGRIPVGFETWERDSAWANLTTTMDKIPAGGIEVHHGEPVYATDGEAGRAQGLIVDLGTQEVTHVVLATGHLWARTRIAVPISSVRNLVDGIRLELTKDEVHDERHVLPDPDDAA
jgi:hypothetical protein